MARHLRSTGRHAQFATAASDCPYPDAYHCKTPDCEQHWPPGTVRPATVTTLPAPRQIRMSQAVRDRRGTRGPTVPDVTYYTDGQLTVPAPPHHTSHPAHWAILMCGHIRHMNTMPGDLLTVGSYVVCQVCPTGGLRHLPDTIRSKMVLACGVCDCHDCGGDSWLPRGMSRIAWLATSRMPGQSRFLISRDAQGTYSIAAQ